MNDFNYTKLALSELEDAMENYRSGKSDIHSVYFKLTTLIFWLGSFLDKKHGEIKDEDKQMEIAIRFACNVLKHDKTIFEIGKKSYIISGICGEMYCGEGLNLVNSVCSPTIIWKELNDNCIENQKGLREYNLLFKHKELDNTFNMIKSIIEKYDINS